MRMWQGSGRVRLDLDERLDGGLVGDGDDDRGLRWVLWRPI